MIILGRYLMVINSSINIIIYCWGGKQFKAVLFNLVSKQPIEYQVSFVLCYVEVPEKN